MPQLILSRGTNYRQNILKKFFPQIELGPYFLIISLIIFVALITVITLLFSARQVTKGYLLNSLETQHQKLVRASEIHDTELSKVRSLNFIQESLKAKSMVKPGILVYVSGETAIAKK